MYWYGHDLSGWGYAGMAVGMVLLWILIVVALLAFFRFNAAGGLRSGAPRPKPTSWAEQQVDAQFVGDETGEAR